MRVHHLFDHDVFSSKFRKLVEGRFKRYGHFEYDTEGEIVRYKVRILSRLINAYTHILHRNSLTVFVRMLSTH
jgi:adenylosuccinate synthase